MNPSRLRAHKPSAPLTALGLFMALMVFMTAEYSLGGSPLSCVELFPLVKGETNSQRLAEYENDSTARLQWIREQNQKTNEALKNSENTKKIGEWIRSLYEKPARVATEVLGPELGELRLVRQGLGKPEELIFVKGQEQSVIASSFENKSNGSVHIVDFKLSPDKATVALIEEENGSTDRFQIRFISLKTGERRQLAKLQTRSAKVYWLDKTLYFNGVDGKALEYNTSERPKDPSPSNQGIVSQRKGITLLKANKRYYVKTAAEVLEIQSGFTPKEILGESEGSVFVSFEENTDMPSYSQPDTLEIRRFSEENKRMETMGERLLLIENRVNKSASIEGRFLFVQDAMGAEQTLRVFGLDGQAVATVNAPIGTSITKATFGEDPNLLKVTLTSNVVGAKEFIYDVNAKRFQNPHEVILQTMLTSKGVVYESRIEEVRSKDGTMIPVRITHRKDLQDRANPVYMNIYGGFETATGFYPSFSTITADFLARGGILVDPAVRGGNEFGTRWSKIATKHAKIKTLEDVVATARYLVRKKYTTPDKVIIYGASNGGMVVAASALLSPKDFGLAIALNGVQDLLRKEVLDAEFGEGWKSEYGDSRTDADQPYLAKISPVEQAARPKQGPKILIFNGRNDSRVNPTHSYKLNAALVAASGQVNMTSINNSGHWMNSIAYQGLIGWRVNTIQWTAIYDHLGWTR